MKKIYIAMAALVAVTLFSCEQEKSFNDEKLSENTLVFTLKGAPSTRSVENSAIIEKGVTFELGTDENGNSFFMEETIQDLNAAWAPATKGTPAYTENVGVLYEKMGVRAGSSNYEFYSMDNSEGSATGEMVDGGWRYQGEFTWAQDAYDFYFWMPTTGNGITGTPTYGKTGNDLSITFDYKTPDTAANQKDLIFAARNITKAEALDNRVNGVPVLFNHALTGVKFAIKNYDATKKITITSVSFTGLYDVGKCTITPAKENNYRDKPTDEYSSGDGRVVWPAANLSKSGASVEIKSGTFTFDENGPVKFEGGSFDSKGNYPASFSAAGNENNLNDKDASQTFWLIPQAMTDDVKLTIHYTFGSDEDQTWVIDFGTIVAARGDVWKAGQLRTYTLKVDDINVHIADEISSSHIKQNIAITNTGNTDAFIRATIIGNWCSPDGAAVFGYTDFVDNPGQYVEIPSWTIDNPGEGAAFVGLPATGWVRGKDNYFYYKTALEPGAKAPALFTSYTPGTVPDFQLAGKPVDAHFVMEIATQAISAKKPDASPYASWSAAWENALGYNPSAN